MDATWKEWRKLTEQLETNVYQIRSAYFKNGHSASSAEGVWSKGNSHYTLSANVSDDTAFAFSFTIEDERLFIHSGDEWRQSSTKDRFINELTPLDDPFVWIRDMLSHADQVEKNSADGNVNYVATFTGFDEVDFRGYSLEGQEDTTLTLTIEADSRLVLTFDATPIRPKYIGVFDDYPERIVYEMSLEKTTTAIPPLPEEAYSSRGLDD